MHPIGFGQWRLSSRCTGRRHRRNARRRRPDLGPHVTRLPNVRAWAGARSAPTGTKEKSTMRAMFLALLIALGMGLVGASSSLAAPVNGGAIHHAAHLNKGVDT